VIRRSQANGIAASSGTVAATPRRVDVVELAVLDAALRTAHARKIVFPSAEDIV